MTIQRTTKDIRVLVCIYDGYDELDDVNTFTEAEDTEFDLTHLDLPELGVEDGDRFDRLVEHDWVEVDMNRGTFNLTYSGWAIARYASTHPEKLEEKSVTEIVRRAGNDVGMVLR